MNKTITLKNLIDQYKELKSEKIDWIIEHKDNNIFIYMDKDNYIKSGVCLELGIDEKTYWDNYYIFGADCDLLIEWSNKYNYNYYTNWDLVDDGDNIEFPANIDITIVDNRED